MISPSTAAEVIYNFSLWMPDCYNNHFPYRSKYGPGQWVENRSEETRVMLRELKSDDLTNIRPDCVYVRPSYQQQQKEDFSNLKLKFDKEILKQ